MLGVYYLDGDGQGAGIMPIMIIIHQIILETQTSFFWSRQNKDHGQTKLTSTLSPKNMVGDSAKVESLLVYIVKEKGASSHHYRYGVTFLTCFLSDYIVLLSFFLERSR